MGKGGQRNATADVVEPSKAVATSQNASSTSSTSSAAAVWKSPYNPLDPQAPTLPTKGEIRAVIPPHCFQHSNLKSIFYVTRDLYMAAALVYATSFVLSTDVPSWTPEEPWTLPLWVAGWMFYAFWQGTIGTGIWVLAHECGHGAFSSSPLWNDVVGFILHQALLVPYFGWQYTHAKHHRRTNHLVDGESHVPSTREENGFGPNNERLSLYATMHEAIGDGAFAAFQVWAHLCVGWPLYLLGVASTGRLAYDGSFLNGRTADHFRPNSPMYPPKMRVKVFCSTATVVASLVLLGYLMKRVGVLPVMLWYGFPYFMVNAWLVLYTWLQHTDPSVPHYGDDDWTWVKGALATIDRPYGIFDFFHHTIGSTHVVHHLFHEMPWYNAIEATRHVKAFLEPKGLYNYDPLPWYSEMWRVAKRCHYVEDYQGIQYLKSVEDVPLTKNNKKKNNKQL